MRANEVLEARVFERTRALEEAKRGLEAVNAQLKRMSTTDALTQLANRGHFDLTLDEEIRRAQRLEQPLSVLLLDIDHFKQINDTYGHPFGDECLRQVAATLKQHGQRAGDLVARYGGEEFVIALPGIDSHRARQQAERIRAAIAGLHPTHGDRRLDLTISIGVAILQPPMSRTPAQLLAAADAALYRAKRNGRNQVVVADEVI
ncbi:GGDEF domain-containing protein [Stutzerimonas stutzeri]|uniref:GGDEF domain-containing protein n=1 Tax=Stutzerimonas stutzeri TaxID=316 RepID=UPI0037187117